jgi:DNA-binding MarR family transcriptional regulator
MEPRAPRQIDELRGLMQRLFRRFGALAGEATPCGKPLPMAHAHALMVLLGRADASQQELGRELGIDKSNIARLCARMVEAGHVSQRQSEDDGRSRRVSLTARGERLANEVDEASKARFGALLVALPPASRGAVIEALRQLVAGIEESSATSRGERTRA